MAISKGPAPLQPNKRPWICPTCHKEIAAGAGLMRRNRWCDTPSLGRWHFEHPDCAGERYWVLDHSGLVYALAELGPQRRAIVKVGKTIRAPMKRIYEIITADEWAPHKTPVQLWGAHTSNRHDAEKHLHDRLAPHRVAGLHGYQREAYVVAMDIVLSAMREVADEEPQLLWEKSPSSTPAGRPQAGQ